MRSIFALAILGLLVAGCASAPPEGVPKSVIEKYDELRSKYSEGLGAILNNCTRVGAKTYIVVGSGGFSGVTYIYDGSGALLQHYDWDDMVEPGETPPPFDSSLYKCAIINESKPPDGPAEAPPAAVARYRELSANYSQSLGAYLSRCEKGGSTVYTVGGSGGFSGVTYYYDSQGKQIGPAFYWDDMVSPDEPKPPVDVSDYNCTTLNESRKR
jgi:hypothetical protein